MSTFLPSFPSSSTFHNYLSVGKEVSGSRQFLSTGHTRTLLSPAAVAGPFRGVKNVLNKSGHYCHAGLMMKACSSSWHRIDGREVYLGRCPSGFSMPANRVGEVGRCVGLGEVQFWFRSRGSWETIPSLRRQKTVGGRAIDTRLKIENWHGSCQRVPRRDVWLDF